MSRDEGLPAVDDPPPPAATDELLGHTAVERQMLEASMSGRVPHAWLLVGPWGVGKATLAFRFARFLLSGAADGDQSETLFGAPPAPDSLHVAADSQTARLVASQAHPDLLVVERQVHKDDLDKPAAQQRLSRDLSVDQIRRLGPFLSLTPALSAWRVVIVDGADGMNRSAANAVLKLLEEPPARSVILMTCESPGRLLPTIRSRCRVVQLDCLPEAAVTSWLSRHQPSLGEGDRLALSRLSEGSPGRAARLAAAGGMSLFRELISLMEAVPQIDMAAVTRLATRLGPAQAEASYRLFAELLRWWLARLIRAIGRGALPQEVTAGEAAVLSRLAAGASLERWMEVWDKSGLLLDRADRANLDRGLALIEVFTHVRGAFR